MADKYVITGAIGTTTASPGDTAAAIVAATTTRGLVVEVDFGHGGTPADNSVNWVCRRFTAAGTEGSGVTPAKVDSAAPAAQLDGAEGHTVEPTYTAASELLDIDVNQRATFRWVAPPGLEWVVPATSANGIGCTPISSAYTGESAATIVYFE